MGSGGTRTRPRLVAVATVGTVLLVALLAARAVQRLVASDLLAALRRVDWRLLVLAALGNLPLVWCKAGRMCRLVDRRISRRRMMGFFVSSYAADNLRMSQAGPGVRVALLKREGVPLRTAVGAQVLDKVCDAIGLGVVAVLLFAPAGLGVAPSRGLGWCLALAAAAVVGLAVMRLSRRRRACRPRGALAIAALTLGAWLVEIGMVAAALQAFGFDAGVLGTAALIVVAVNVAAVAPGLPANLGTFEAACVAALHAAGVSVEAGLAFALVYHLLHTLPVTVIGLPGLRRLGR